MEATNNNQDSQFKMENDKKKKKKKKGRLRRGLKKVLDCFLCCTSSTSKGSPDDDVYEPSTSKTQTASSPSSSEMQKVSESSATKTQKTKKHGFMARLKAKMSRSQPKRSNQTDSTVSAPPKYSTVLRDAAMILGSDTSDNSDEVPVAQKKRHVLEEKVVLEKVHAPSITSLEALYSTDEDDQFSSASASGWSYEPSDVSKDFVEEQSSPVSFTFSDCSDDTSGLQHAHLDTEVARGLRCMHVHSFYEDLFLSSMVMEDSDELTQEEILQLIQCSFEPPKHQKEADYDGQEQPAYANYMGFPNMGNTCYMNSTLQCFLSLPPVVKDVVCQENIWKNEHELKMLRAFYDLHIARLNKTHNIPRTYLLAAVKDCIAMRNPIFGGSDQQDAHEFLITLLAQLKDEAEMCQLAENPVANLEFRVNRLRTCKTCGTRSCSTEEVNCLSLVIGPQKSLIESLQQYFASSQLECYCDKCQGTQASESVEIQTLPRVLVLLVMRFDMFTLRKIKDRLAVPEELSMASFTGSDSCEQVADLYSKEATKQAKQHQADATYKLSGVVSHLGSSLHCGHYVSNIRDPCGAEWLRCDDTTVKYVTWSKASNTIEYHGYMLFYLRS